MVRKIVPWKNTGEKGQEMIKTFKIRWDMAKGKWIPDPKGPHLGYLVNSGGIPKIVRHIPRDDPKKKEIGLDASKLIFDKPSLGVAEEESEEDEQ